MSEPLILSVPDAVVVATWQAFRDGARAGCESTVRWAGPAQLLGAPVQIVTTVIVPEHRMAPGSFDVPHAATRTMGDALARTGLVNMAQVHTHPSDWVGHSAWDDQRAYSTRDGALSIVWPNYGRTLEVPTAWGIHECRQRTWIALSGEERARRVVVVPSLLDLRIVVESWGSNDVNGESQVAPRQHAPARRQGKRTRPFDAQPATRTSR